MKGNKSNILPLSPQILENKITWNSIHWLTNYLGVEVVA